MKESKTGRKQFGKLFSEVWSRTLGILGILGLKCLVIRDRFLMLKYRKNYFLADLIFFTHFLLGLFLVSGWYFDTFSLLYMLALILTLVSQIIFGYCILSKWEFNLRKKADPGLNYDYAYVSYYTYKFLKIHISAKYIKWTSIVFLMLMLLIEVISY